MEGLKTKLPHFKELDGIRGLAALAVFFHHFLNQSTGTRFQIVPRIAVYGNLGVEVFFVLSGFLITSLLLIDRDDPHLLNNFYWKRILRIWPVLIVHLVIPVVLFHQFSFAYTTVALLFIANFGFRLGVGGIGATWSLSIEEQFYLIWPQLIRKCELRVVFWVSCFFIVVSAGLRFVVPLLRHDAVALPYTIYQLDGLAFGALLSCQWYSHRTVYQCKWRSRVVQFVNGRWSLGMGLLLVTVICVLHRSNLGVGLEIFAACFFAYRLLALIVLSTGEIAALSWLKSSPMRFLGDVSYPLYMYHGYILSYLVARYGGIDMNYPFMTLVRLGWSLVLCLLVSYASFRLIEVPIRKLRKYTVKDVLVRVAG